MSQPQIMWILENVYLSKGNVTTLKVYDMFVEAESMIVEITPAFQNGFAQLKFFVDDECAEINDF